MPDSVIKLGRAAVLKVGTSTADQAVARLTDLSVSFSRDEVDTTTFDNVNGFRSYIMGSADLSVDGSFIYLTDTASTTGQHLIFANFDRGANDTALKVIVEFDGATDNLTADGYITSLSISGGMDDVQTVDFTMRLSGDVNFDPSSES